MTKPVHGIVGSPVTPFTADNRVDDAILRRLVDFLIRHGAHAVAMPMHMGESVSLSVEERRQVARIGVEAAAGRVPVFVNVSMSGTDEAIALARHAESIGAEGVVLIAPYHWQPPRQALLEHFAAVAAAVTIGLIAYNNPARIAVTLTPDLLLDMIDRCPNFIGLKDAGMNMEYFTEACRVAQKTRPDFAVLTAGDYFLPGMAVGGAGALSGAGAIAPRLTHALYDACAAGDYARARPLQHRLSHLLGVIKANYPAGIKAAMGVMGRPVGPPRRPVSPLDAGALDHLARDLERLGIVADEPHGW